VLHDDVIILVAQLIFTNWPCLEQNLFSEYCQINSRLPAMAFYNSQNFLLGFPRNQSNGLSIRKNSSGQSSILE